MNLRSTKETLSRIFLISGEHKKKLWRKQSSYYSPNLHLSLDELSTNVPKSQKMKKMKRR